MIRPRCLLYSRQMRYQSKPNRPLSYLPREAANVRETREGKQNKENSNVLNQAGSKLPRNKEVEGNGAICKVKLEHKISETTNYSSATSVLSKVSFGEQLKKTYTTLIKKDYSSQILSHLCESAEGQTGLLLKHGISSSLRSKMVDWMIEVLSSYKMSEQTYFRSLYLMDGYLKNCPTRLQVKDLHLVGVTSMFAAAKLEQIHPLKLSVIYEKIARKKFTKNEILEKQADIVNTLNFKLESPSIYDIARIAVEQIKLTISEASVKYYKKIILYLAKMALFSDELVEEHPTLLAGAIVFIGLKTLEQVDPQAAPETHISQICNLLQLQQALMIESSRKVLELAKNFSKYYPTLSNLKKFNKFEYGSE